MNLYNTSVVCMLYNENWTFILHLLRFLHSYSNTSKKRLKI
jgi:hypothetical protein